MKIEVRMPRLSESMTEGTVTAWFASEGDEVREGEAIAEIETEKSTVDLPAPASGVLARIAVAAGSGAVAVGTLLAEIESERATTHGEPVSLAAVRAERESHGDAHAHAVAAKRAATVAPTPAHPVAAIASRQPQPAGEAFRVGVAAANAPHEAAAATSPDDEAIPATPLARRMAAQAGLSLASLAATGIGGKICKADVEAALGRTASPANAAARPASRAPAPAAPASVEAATADQAFPMSRIRRTVAERMARAKATIPHFYLSVDCRVDRLLEVRRRLKDDGTDVSINDFVVRAAGIALARVPDANASWNEGIVRHARIDIAVAVALEDGLVTPVVRDAGSLGLAAISASIRDLAARARAGSLVPHEYDGATFTISNLGMHGVGEMFAIINPPQACILGVGAAEPRPVVEAGQVVAGTVMTLSLSADHRVLDGATGAKLLAQVRRLLEEPALMLA